MEDRILKSLENLIECASGDMEKKELGRVLDDFKGYFDKLENPGRKVSDERFDAASEGKPVSSRFLMMVFLIRNLRLRIVIMRFMTDDNNLARLLQDEMDFLRVEYLEPIMNMVLSESPLDEGEVEKLINR